MFVVVAWLAATLVALAQPTHAPAVFVGERRLNSSAVVLLGGKVYIGLRAVGETLGADVEYSPKKHQVTITTLLHQSVLKVTPAGDARLAAGRVVVALRQLGAALGVGVRYDARSHAVRVDTAGLGEVPSGAPTPPPLAKTNTIEGTVSRVNAQSQPAAIEVEAASLAYTITVPPGTPIQFRDTQGAIAGNGDVSQVKPGDALIATLDSAGHLLSVADIFAGTSGVISAIAGNDMVLTNGKVIVADASATAVTVDGVASTLADLRPGDLVAVRANPRTGRVREIVAMTPASARASAQPQASPGPAAVGIDSVSDDAAQPLRAGQALHVWATGTAGATASFDLSNIVLAVPMRELSPGRYSGAYTAAVGTNMVDAPIFVRMRRGADTAVRTSANPLTIITQPPQVKDMAPSPGARIDTGRPSIYATFATLGGKGMDTSSLRLYVDGKDVSDQATRTAGFVQYYPADDLPVGPTTVEVKGVDVAGNALDYRWSFVIAAR